MFYEHSRLSTPPDDTVIWRYITFTKFCSMLNEQALFFCRLDKLHDKWEGVYPKAMLEYWAKVYQDIPAGDEGVARLKEILIRKIIPSHFVNCWFMSEYESDAMWRLYSRNYEGIAIKSTIGRLKRSLAKTRERIWIGPVDYIDYDQWQPPKGEARKAFLWMEPFFWKRLSFQHENELRALVGQANRESGEAENGLNIQADLNELTEAVYVFPDSKDWFLQLVKTIVRKYGYRGIAVKRSSLGERPWE